MRWQDFLTSFSTFYGPASGDRPAGWRCPPGPWQDARQGEWPRDRGETCRDERRHTFEAGAGPLTVDAGGCGTIEVSGWERAEVDLVAVVETRAPSEEAARQLAREIEIETGDRIAARGPEPREDQGWAVAFRLRVPRGIDLDLTARNGEVSVAGVAGGLAFANTNGSVDVDGAAGRVHGRIENGNLSLRLAGEPGRDAEIDVKTTNGTLEILVPEALGGELDAKTQNGRLRVDLPLEAAHRGRRRVAGRFGGGGSKIRARTGNGSICIRRSS